MIINQMELEKKAEILKAVSHPIRLCIVKRLIEEGEANVTRMQNCLGAPQSTVSQHLTKLKAAGIIAGTRYGTEIKYRVISEDITKVIKVLF